MMRLVPSLVAVAVLAACSSPADDIAPYPGRRSSNGNTPTPTQRDEPELNPETGGTVGPDQEGSALPGDADGDGVPDDQDCAPTSAQLGERVVEDDLSTSKGLFAGLAGFPTASWEHALSAYRQTRIGDVSDASVHVTNTNLENIQINVTAASTEVANISPQLRQIFVLFGATSNGGQLAGHGCGIEVVAGEATTQKTSVVRLAGGPNAVTTSVLQRVDRGPVVIDEEFAILLRVKDGSVVCSVTQGGVTTTTAEASGVDGLRGAVGFFTRQTKALFKNIRVCKI
jgi:hypothetical protein